MTAQSPGPGSPSGPDAEKPAPPGGGWRLPLALIVGMIAAMGGMLLVTELGRLGGGAGDESASGPASDPGSRVSAELRMDLVSIHRAATGAGVYQIRTGDPLELSAWFAGESGAAVPVPVLDDLGLSVTGGRMLRLLKQPAPMMVFEQLGGVISAGSASQPDVVLIAAPHSPEAGPLPGGEYPEGVYLTALAGIGMAFFEHDGRRWILTSERTPEGLMALVRAVRGAPLRRSEPVPKAAAATAGATRSAKIPPSHP